MCNHSTIKSSTYCIDTYIYSPTNHSIFTLYTLHLSSNIGGGDRWHLSSSESPGHVHHTHILHITNTALNTSNTTTILLYYTNTTATTGESVGDVRYDQRDRAEAAEGAGRPGSCTVHIVYTMRVYFICMTQRTLTISYLYTTCSHSTHSYTIHHYIQVTSTIDRVKSELEEGFQAIDSHLTTIKNGSIISHIILYVHIIYSSGICTT